MWQKRMYENFPCVLITNLCRSFVHFHYSLCLTSTEQLNSNKNNEYSNNNTHAHTHLVTESKFNRSYDVRLAFDASSLSLFKSFSRFNWIFSPGGVHIAADIEIPSNGAKYLLIASQNSLHFILFQYIFSLNLTSFLCSK